MSAFLFPSALCILVGYGAPPIRLRGDGVVQIGAFVSTVPDAVCVVVSIAAAVPVYASRVSWNGSSLLDGWGTGFSY